MQSYPNISKIIAPRLPRVLMRPRLVERILENRNRSLILILGQAAQGKSTLAVSSLEALGTLSAWVNLDEEDSDAVNLLHLLGQSLQRALGGSGTMSCFDLNPCTGSPRDEIAIYRDWAQLLFAQEVASIHIVLDALDRLRPNASSFSFLRVLLQEMPPSFHLMMLSRKIPPLEIQALKVRQMAHVITNEELAFTFDETRAFFRKLRPMPLTRPQLRKIQQVTEGWPGGLILLAESLAQRTADASGSAILDVLPDHFSKEVFRYYGEGVFAALPRDVQEFLLKASIADTIEPDLVKEFTGRAEAAEILQDLEARNLFVQSVYDRSKGWLFRYHQLFRKFLRTKFRADVPEEARLALYRKAGRVCEQRKDWEDAVKYYLEAQEFIRAEILLQKIGLDVLKRGRTGDLAKWLDSLPEALVLGNPWLLFYQYMTNRLSTSQHPLLQLQRALDLFREQREVSGHLLALAHLIEAALTRGRPRLPSVQALLAEGEQLLQTTPLDAFLYERAILWCQIGHGHYLRTGNLRKAYWACTHAYQLGQYLGDNFLQINALVHCYGALTLLGQFSRGEKLAEKAEALLETRNYPELRVGLDLKTVQLYLIRGALQSAAQLLEKVSHEVELHGLTHFYPVVMLHEIWLKISLADYEDAERLTESYADFTQAMGNLFLYGNAFLYGGLGQYWQGDYFRAAESLDHARYYFSSNEARAELHLNVTAILHGLVSYHLGTSGGTETELPGALAYFQEIGSLPLLKEVHLALALIEQEQGRLREAAAHLKIGLEIMQQRTFDWCHLLRREDFLKACILALELQVENARDFAGELLATRLAAEGGAELERLSTHADARVAESAWKVRSRIHRARLPQLHIVTFGGFRLIRGSDPVGDKEWPARQPRLLLQAIVARGSRGVPKDLLIDDLWPESASLSADKTFKVILHRLRRVLEPEIQDDFGPTYVQLKSNLLTLDPELCHVDVDEFLNLLQSGAWQEKDGDIKEALLSYQQAVELYKGDFLPEEMNSLTINERREELRASYIGLLVKMAALYEARGVATKAIVCYRKLVKTDPLLEDAYRKLMGLYANSRMYNEALKVYEACKEALRNGLNAEPDALTTAIYRKVLDTRPPT